MAEPILYIDTSDILPGKLETVGRLMTDLAAGDPVRREFET